MRVLRTIRRQRNEAMERVLFALIRYYRDVSETAVRAEYDALFTHADQNNLSSDSR